MKYSYFIDIMGTETAHIFYNLCRFADEEKFNRREVIITFLDMMDAILEQIDPEKFDLNNQKHYN